MRPNTAANLMLIALLAIPAAALAEDGDVAPPDEQAQAALQAMERLCQEKDGECQQGEALMKQVRKDPRMARHMWRHRKWIRTHQDAAGAMARAMVRDRKFLADNPEVAREMFRNRRFMVRNPEVVGQLMEHKRFMQKHPEVARSILQHREFSKKHPEMAKKLKRMLQHQNQHRRGK